MSFSRYVLVDTFILIGSYTCLEVKLNLQREISNYINEYFVPSSLVVGFSFVSFFIDYKSVGARAPLTGLNVLSFTFLLSGNCQDKKIFFSKCLHFPLDDKN